MLGSPAVVPQPDDPRSPAFDPTCEESLRSELDWRSVELDLRTIPSLLAEPEAKSTAKSGAEPIASSRRDNKLNDATIPRGTVLDKLRAGEIDLLQLAPRYQELCGLPFIRGPACRKPQADARDMETASRYLLQFKALSLRSVKGGDSDFSFAEEIETEGELAARLAKEPHVHGVAAAPAVAQVLQGEATPARLVLIELLSEVHTAAASAAIADRAMFDLSPQVRMAARLALVGRPPKEYRQRLFAGLRYPWPPVADHAAEALAAVGDVDSLPELTALVDLPDPAAPFRNEQGLFVKHELVRVNHLRNCLLCHAASNSTKDLVRGAMPIPGEQLPKVYYCEPRASFVRADITFLRQDFSIQRRVANAAPWPTLQRYDYFVRTRELTKTELDAVTSPENGKVQRSSYPQRMAVLYALGELMARAPDSSAQRPAPSETAAAAP
jgi:hypothetical protein